VRSHKMKKNVPFPVMHVTRDEPAVAKSSYRFDSLNASKLLMGFCASVVGTTSGKGYIAVHLYSLLAGF